MSANLNRYVLIGNNSVPFKGRIPTTITLPVTDESITDGIGVSLVTVREGDPDYEKAVQRWMFRHGYCLPEDNDREMTQLSSQG